MKKYSTIVADPPWPYHSPKAVVGNGGRGSMGGKVKEMTQTNVLQHYNTMTIEEIKAMGVGLVAETDSHLYLWTTNSFLVEAHEVCRAWGFTPKTVLTWVKVKSDGSPSMKTGYWYRSATEHCVFAVKGKLRLSGPPHPTAFMTPRLPHSVKPDEFYEIAESQSPANRLDIFARRERPGWDSWGNQSPMGVWDFATGEVEKSVEML